MKTSPVRLKKIHLGYSLIELAVVIFIIMILFGLGIANYRDFTRRKSLERAATQVRGDLELARQYANSGRKPSQCDELQGVGLVKQGSEYQIEALCIIGSDQWQECHQIHRPTLCLKSNISLPSSDFSLTFVPQTHKTYPYNHTVIFYVLGRGSNAGTTPPKYVRLRITDSVTGRYIDIIITPDGRIE